MNVREVADRLLRELAPVDPAAAEARGDEPESIMPALAPADFAARHEAYRRAQQAMRDGVSAAGTDRALTAALRERVDSELALDEAGFTTSLLAPLATPVHEVREVFDTLPHESAADWERVADHLERVPSALADYAETLRASAAAGFSFPSTGYSSAVVVQSRPFSSNASGTNLPIPFAGSSCATSSRRLYATASTRKDYTRSSIRI